jgi:hypothetical protein
MSDVEMMQPVAKSHALYGVRVEVIPQEDDHGLLPALARFYLPPESNSYPVQCGEVHFQNGPIKEAGVNGIGIEHLLHLVAWRLRGYQGTDFRCRENALALTKIEEALHWLQARTEDRQGRGVEGTGQV